MDDAKTGHDIRERAYALMNGKRGLVPSDADLGRAARELLAKPEATREALAEYLGKTHARWVLGSDTMDALLGMVNHFVPPARPKMMIQGMSVDDLQMAMQKAEDDFGHGNAVPRAAAEEAHRLANTPAPEHDPDAEAKRLAWVHYRNSYETGSYSPHKDQRALWDVFTKQNRIGWRAVAAAKKEAAGE